MPTSHNSDREKNVWKWLANQGVMPECPMCHAQHNNQHQNLELKDVKEGGVDGSRWVQVRCERCALMLTFDVDAKVLFETRN